MLAQLRTWLVTNVAEVAALSGQKVHVSQADQGVATPHVVLTLVREDPNNDLAGVGSSSVRLKSAEIDIDCKAPIPDDAGTLANAIERDLEPYTGAMGSITCKAVILEDRRDWYESAKPGRDVDQHVSTLQITFQYR